MDTSLVSKKRQKKGQLQLQRQDLIDRFCKMDEDDITSRSKSIYLLAKISGIFFENETITVVDKRNIISNLHTLISTNKQSIKEFDTYSANFIGAQVQEEKDKIKQKQQQHSTNVFKTKVLSANNNVRRKEKTYDGKSTRIEIRLNMSALPTDTSLTGQLSRQLQELVDKIVETDSTVKILPWFLKEENVPLENNRVPEDKRTFTKYFQRLQPKNTGFVYGEMRLQHERRWEDIVFDLTPWLTETKSAIYFQQLQCQATTNLGWLL
jgi:hypothetical protein